MFYADNLTSSKHFVYQPKKVWKIKKKQRNNAYNKNRALSLGSIEQNPFACVNNCKNARNPFYKCIQSSFTPHWYIFIRLHIYMAQIHTFFFLFFGVACDTWSHSWYIYEQFAFSAKEEREKKKQKKKREIGKNRTFAICTFTGQWTLKMNRNINDFLHFYNSPIVRFVYVTAEKDNNSTNLSTDFNKFLSYFFSSCWNSS